jgi:hypothetical protein
MNTYQRRKADGVCVLCGGQKACDTLQLACYQCRKGRQIARRLRIQKLRQQGKCITCGQKRDTVYSRCEACRKRCKVNKTNYIQRINHN